MDFALQQLIADTGDVRSAIRGHSLAHDMYGNDASNNGYLAGNPSSGAPLHHHQHPARGQFRRTLRLPDEYPDSCRDPTFYGYNFTRWTMQAVVHRAPAAPGTGGRRPDVRDPLRQLPRPAIRRRPSAGSGFHVFTGHADRHVDLPRQPHRADAQNGPRRPWQRLRVLPAIGTGTTIAFILDGRRLRAFNGPGMGRSSPPSQMSQLRITATSATTLP